MESDFLHTTLGAAGFEVHRIGLSATYRCGKKTIHRALDEGLNYFFAFGIDSQMIKTMREVIPQEREKYVIATGAYNLLYGHPNLRRTLEKRLRQFRTDYIDLFMFLGVTAEKHMTEHIFEEFHKFKEEGKVRAIGMSTHQRKFAGRLAEEGRLDVLMIRYNTAHRGAEKDIFPYLEKHNPGIVSFTATRWRALIHRPKSWSKEEGLPTAGMCYRFVLSNPNVHICMMAPTGLKQFEANMKEIKTGGALNEEEMEFMKRFGDAVYNRKKWFM